MNTVAVIDYGMGNLHSVAKALEHVAPDQRILVTADHSQILEADRVVLPGVGAMRDCMGEIRRLGLDKIVQQVAGSRPLLGVCVGMQAMMDFSAENNGVACLGLFKGSVEPFDQDMRDATSGERLKVPHMGWNQVRPSADHPLWQGIAPDSRFYFVHSYYVRPEDAGVLAGTCEYGVRFAAAIAGERIFAVQFHPEKSQHAGLQLYANFVAWSGAR